MGVGRESANNGNLHQPATEGMAEMSEKFKEMGGEVYVETLNDAK